MIKWKAALQLKDIVFPDTVVLDSISDTIFPDCRRPWWPQWERGRGWGGGGENQVGGDFLFIVLSFYIRCKEDFLLSFFLITLISGGRRCRTWRSGSRWSRRWSTRPTLPSSRTRTRTCETWTSRWTARWTALWTWIRVGGGQVGSKWSIRCFRKPTVFADCETFQKGAKLKLRHNKRSKTLGVTLVHTQQC